MENKFDPYEELSLLPATLVPGIPYHKDLLANEYHLSGSRMSGKTRRLVKEIVKSHIVALKYGFKIKTYAFRNMNKDVKESIYQEFLDELERVGVEFTQVLSSLTIVFAKGNEITCKGLHTQNNTGGAILSGIAGNNNARRVYIWFEEAYQISKADRQSVKEAMRDADEVIELNSCNPWLLQNEYIQFLNDRMPFSKEALQLLYHQKGRFREIYNDEATGIKREIKRILIYTNWRANQYLKETDMIKMLELEVLDPKRAEVASWGMPGAEEGSIFSQYMGRVNPVEWYESIAEVSIGIDYGEALSATTASLWARDSQYMRIGKIGEFFHSNANFKWNTDSLGKLGPQDLARETMLEIKKWGEKYPFITNQPGGVTCYVDNSATAWMSILQDYARSLGMYWVNFKKCVKIDEYLRIDFWRNLMAEGRIYMNTECKQGLREYDTMIWDERTLGSSTPKAKDENNHTFDADIYCIMKWMNKLKDASRNQIMYKEKTYWVSAH